MLKLDNNKTNHPTSKPVQYYKKELNRLPRVIYQHDGIQCENHSDSTNGGYIVDEQHNQQDRPPTPSWDGSESDSSSEDTPRGTNDNMDSPGHGGVCSHMQTEEFESSESEISSCGQPTTTATSSTSSGSSDKGVNKDVTELSKKQKEKLKLLADTSSMNSSEQSANNQNGNVNNTTENTEASSGNQDSSEQTLTIINSSNATRSQTRWMCNLPIMNSCVCHKKRNKPYWNRCTRMKLGAFILTLTLGSALTGIGFYFIQESIRKEFKRPSVSFGICILAIVMGLLSILASTIIATILVSRKYHHTKRKYRRQLRQRVGGHSRHCPWHSRNLSSSCTTDSTPFIVSSSGFDVTPTENPVYLESPPPYTMADPPSYYE